MAGAVSNVLVVAGVVAHELQDKLHNLLVVLLTVSTNEVGLTNTALLNDVPYGVIVVQYVDPVTHILAGTVELGAHAVDQVSDLTRNELLNVLVGAVVVGAVRDGGLNPERPHPSAYQQVRAGLGGGVGGGGVVRSGGGELGGVIQLQVTVNLIGGDVVEAGAVGAYRL